MFKKSLLMTALLASTAGQLWAQTTAKNPAGIIVPEPSASAAAAATFKPSQSDSGKSAKAMNIQPNAPVPAVGMGRLVFAYGATLPVVTCAPMHVCVINLMPGEVINDLSIGDSVRWLVSSSQAGDRPVVIIKPTEVDVSTNLVVTTNRKRVYYLMLESSATKYLPIIDFYDPQELLIKGQQKQQAQVIEDQAATAAAMQKIAAEAEKKAASLPSGVDPSKLDFNYACTSDGGDDFKPTKIFNVDGNTYLSMPSSMKYADAPAVFNVSSGDVELLNSRLVRDYYVLDGVPSKFKLVIGSKQTTRSVLCERGTKSSFFGK